jgi:thiosulfate/3-mercaptopyruvate sulfurtransferase
MELPSMENLKDVLGKSGISPNSRVVVVPGKSQIPSLDASYFAPTMASRVAITLLYAGVEQVSILNGGYTLWSAEERHSTTTSEAPSAVTFRSTTNEEMFVSKEEVMEKIGKSALLDTRDPDIYFGIEKDMTSTRLGHIPGSRLLPAPWLWKEASDDSKETSWAEWKDAETLREMALSILGEDMDQEIIVYCGVGGYASPVYFILSELAGYTNVKFYDGSMQEWTADPDAPVVKYRYE